MTTENNATSAKKPAYPADHVRNHERGGDGFRTRVGVAFQHAFSKEFNILIDTIPLNGRITLRVPSEKPE